MKHIPTKYKRKAERASYAAGYRAGYTGHGAETLSLAQHLDLRPMYEHGYGDGRGDKHNRKIDREARRLAGNALSG